MINPTESDVGRAVKYSPRGSMFEVGHITSFNERYVFVRYGTDGNAKATRREDLEWCGECRKLEADE